MHVLGSHSYRSSFSFDQNLISFWSYKELFPLNSMQYFGQFESNQFQGFGTRSEHINDYRIIIIIIIPESFYF